MRIHPPSYLTLTFLSFLSFLCAPVCSLSLNWTATPFTPDAVPLAVRSPYLSAWLAQGVGAALNDGWSTFWTGSIVGWAGYVRVDGTPYTFMGIPGGTTPVPAKAVQKSLNWTATQTPLPLPTSSTFLPRAHRHPNDGKEHAVQVYTDITGEWLTSNDSLVANWSTNTGDSGGVWTHQIQLSQQEVYAEVSDRAQYTLVRSYFLANGTLPGAQDTAFRAVSDRWPVLAFERDLGVVSGAGAGTVEFAVGHVRDPVVEYVAGAGTQNRSVHFWRQYENDAISDFLTDHPNALTAAQKFDSRLQADATKVSSNYADMAALSVRQALATAELTISKGSDGAWNTSDTMMFLKEISSSGLASTTDVIFASWPLWLYANPALGKYLLLPVLAYQPSGMYPNQWSVHDLGAYPQALGHNNGKDLAMPVEEKKAHKDVTCRMPQHAHHDSPLPPMTTPSLAPTSVPSVPFSSCPLLTDDDTQYSLLDQWTQYLIANSLMPANQFSTDVFAGTLANQTNLAIKGIVGIKAMSMIANMTGDAPRAADYSSVASGYAERFGQLAYGDGGSWGLAYNIGCIKCPAFVVSNASVFLMSLSDRYLCASHPEDCWYGTVAGTYGVPLDTRRDWYDVELGVAQAFRARAPVGAHLALLVVSSTAMNTSSAGCAIPSTSSVPAFSGTQGPSATASGGAIPSHTSAAARVVARQILLVSLIIPVLALWSCVWV
ncbi:hypothetical protein GLOTRDRAFT_129728 [Gloeophyllum trabeum ATCC 11539]|uniref:DUF1793-domain-containing protein n=1 Tax=Gloeophyllum trabeum (strain ATCC 11539 / FP-39264 / Madison 617) TaxID=670483 RepID=S7RR97_GLOTA|nr:uncharacterized protein GLOTRDRAFT_129728 [Gloeophyllum trabeum ATCC 11539]EPQ55454.1 hypothetical protein GLOTRDRAFT_129728 [Gloeophyllum trabeum ATCC 11539]